MAQNLIMYESFMDIYLDYIADGDSDLAQEYMVAIFNYYKNGELYDGDSKDVRRQMKNIYPLINRQGENYSLKANAIISNEEFSKLAQSGDFKTQKALAEYISQNYGHYTQQSVSKKLKELGISLIKNSTTSFTTGTTEVQIQYNTNTDIDIEKETEKEIDIEVQRPVSMKTEEEKIKIIKGLF